MPVVRLTDRFCAHSKALVESGQTDFFDDVTTGLCLRVASGGTKSWCFFFTDPATGKRARKAFGRYPAISLSDARGLVLQAHEAIARGERPDAVFEPPAARDMAVDAALDLWMELHVVPARKSHDEVRKRLLRHIRPAIGSRDLRSITRGDVLAITDRLIKADTPREANLVFEHLRAFFNWCVAREHVDRSPIAGMRPPAKETPRERVLTDDEVGIMWRGLDGAMTKTKAVPLILRLCLATGQRVGEVSGIALAEIDKKAREWRIPAERSKNGEPHIVPLSDLALGLINKAVSAREDAESAFLFPSGRFDDDAPMTALAVARTLARALAPDKKRPKGRLGIDQFTAHDLRRTALTGLGKLGVAPIVIAAVANHQSALRAGITGRVYMRYTYQAEKRAALELWAAQLSAIVDGKADNIVQMRANNKNSGNSRKA